MLIIFIGIIVLSFVVLKLFYDVIDLRNDIDNLEKKYIGGDE